MKDKGKFFILAIFWLVVSALVISAFAGMITPLPASSQKERAKLFGSVFGRSGEKMEILLEIPEGRDVHAALSLDSGNRHAIRDALELPGNLEYIHIDPDRQIAYLANSHAGLQIVDIANPDNIHLIGSIATPGNAWDVIIRNDTLIFSAGKGGLQIYDVSSPAAPVKVSELIIPNLSLLKLSLYGDIIYASSSAKKGLHIIDISDLEAPVHKRTLLAGEGVWSLVNNGRSLFVIHGRYFCSIYDLENPLHPRTLSRFEVPFYVSQTAIYRGMLYIPVREKELLVYDISDPANPRRTGWSSGKIDVETVELEQGKAYLSNRRGDLFRYDLADPARPRLISVSDTPFKIRNITVHEDSIFVAAGLSGFQVFDISRLPPQKQVRSLQVPGKLSKVLSDENHYYLATNTKGLLIADKTESEALPHIIATLPLPGVVFDMIRSGNHLYLVCNKAGLKVVDISIPDRPELVAELNIPGIFRDIVQDGNQIYIAAGDNGLLSVNISHPETPVLIGNLPLPDARKLALDANRLYALTTSGELHIIDISDPARPTRISSCPLPWPLSDFADSNHLQVADETAYFAAGPAKLILFDLRDENQPKISRIVSIEGEVMCVRVIDSNIFVTTRQRRMFWLQQERDGSIIHRAEIDVLGTSYGLQFDAGTIILTNGYKGLTFMPRPLELSIARKPYGYSRKLNPSLKTIEIPSHLQPGVYNLTLSGEDGISNFIGAVRIAAE